MLEWSERRNYDLHGLDSKLLRAIQSYPWERHLGFFPVWWSWQAVLNFSHIPIKN